MKKPYARIVYGETGTGKTYYSHHVMEQDFMEKGIPPVIIDKKGDCDEFCEHWGVPTVVVSGAAVKEMDVEAVHKIIMQNRDTGVRFRCKKRDALIETKTEELGSMVCSAMLRIERIMVTWIPEVHNFAPSNGSSELIAPLIKLNTEGRSLDKPLVQDSQKPQQVHHKVANNTTHRDVFFMGDKLNPYEIVFGDKSQWTDEQKDAVDTIRSWEIGDRNVMHRHLVGSRLEAENVDGIPVASL